MKTPATALILSLLLVPTLAVAAPPAPAAPPAAEAPAAAEKFSVATTPIETLAADPKARALLVKHLPGLLEHEAYDSFKGMPLESLKPFSNGAITDETLKALQADLDKLP